MFEYRVLMDVALHLPQRSFPRVLESYAGLLPVDD